MTKKTTLIKPYPKGPAVREANRLLDQFKSDKTAGVVQAAMDEQMNKAADPRYEAIKKYLPDLTFMDWCNAKAGLYDSLRLLGFRCDGDKSETPARFLQYIGEFLNDGRNPSSPVSLSEVLGRPFETPLTERDGIAGMVVQTNIPFRMACGHHLLPAMGLCSIGYIPRKQVVGLSKLSRLVDWVATIEPGMQEKIGNDIADALLNYLEPIGVIVVITAEHSCMGCRGVASPNTPTITSTLRGAFRDNVQAREEFFNLISTHRR